MAEEKNNLTENENVNETTVNPEAAKHAATPEEPAVVEADGFFTKIGKTIDGGFTKVKNFGKRNGKKIAKGAGVAAGAAVAVIGTAIVVDTMERAKALSDGTEPSEAPIDVDPVAVEDVSDPAEAEYLEAEAAEVAA